MRQLQNPVMNIIFEIWSREHEFANDDEAWELVAAEDETIDLARARKQEFEGEDATREFSIVRSIDIRETVR